jgi:hypothetical protein
LGKKEENYSGGGGRLDGRSRRRPSNIGLEWNEIRTELGRGWCLCLYEAAATQRVNPPAGMRNSGSGAGKRNSGRKVEGGIEEGADGRSHELDKFDVPKRPG